MPKGEKSKSKVEPKKIVKPKAVKVVKVEPPVKVRKPYTKKIKPEAPPIEPTVTVTEAIPEPIPESTLSDAALVESLWDSSGEINAHDVYVELSDEDYARAISLLAKLATAGKCEQLTNDKRETYFKK